MDDVIKEEDEDEADAEVNDDIDARGENDNLLRSPDFGSRRTTPARPRYKGTPGIFNRFMPSFKRHTGGLDQSRDPDLMEANLGPSLRQTRSRGASSGMAESVSSLDDAFITPAKTHRSFGSRRARSTGPDALNANVTPSLTRERGMSMSSGSSHDVEIWQSRHFSLGLEEMNPVDVPVLARKDQNLAPVTETEEDRPIYVWTASHDRATVLRIGFKKRISAVWLEAYALKQYVELNHTAFEKILKKFDKNTGAKMKKTFMSDTVDQAYPWLQTTKNQLDALLAQTLFLYRRVVVAGDEDLAKEQLRSQLRDKVVVDRETVWSQMVAGRNPRGVFRSVEHDVDGSTFDRQESGNASRMISPKFIIFLVALALLVIIIIVQPFRRVEESNCLAMLVFCTILWATEVSLIGLALD